MKKHFLAGLALIGAVFSAPASATVSLGDTVTCGGFSFECSTERATVGTGSEFGIDFGRFGTLLLADFTTGLLTISYANNPELPDGAPFGETFALFFSNETNPFTFAELGNVDGVEGLDDSSVSVDGGFVTVNLSNVTFGRDSSLQVKFDRTVTPPPAGAVPEPSSFAMMILGFALVGFAMRRRTTATVQPLLA